MGWTEFSGVFSTVFPLLVLILTLIFRPQGLFGKKGRLA